MFVMLLESFITQIPGYEFIDGFISDTLPLRDWIDAAYDFVVDVDAVTLVIGVALAGIIFIMGTFELLKKLSKLIVVVGILVGLYLLYSNGALDGIIG